jgi:hypothetical protein
MPKRAIINVPELISGRVMLNDILEPPSAFSDRLLILNYKVGSLNEHLVKYRRLGQSSVQCQEFKMNLAETICHCLTIATVLGWDIPALVNQGWEKIGDRFKDFVKEEWTPTE